MEAATLTETSEVTVDDADINDATLTLAALELEGVIMFEGLELLVADDIAARLRRADTVDTSVYDALALPLGDEKVEKLPKTDDDPLTLFVGGTIVAETVDVPPPLKLSV